MDYQKLMKLDILDSLKAKQLIQKFNVKRVIAGRGHDCGGLLADLCLGRKVLAEYSDDGWGGEAEVRFTTTSDELFLADEFKKANFAQEVFDHGYEFMGTVDKIGFYLMVDVLVQTLVRIKDDEKMMKQTKNKLIFGNKHSYKLISWKGLKNLKDLPLSQLQKAYDKHKKDLRDGQRFFNTNEQLKSLGVKL